MELKKWLFTAIDTQHHLPLASKHIANPSLQWHIPWLAFGSRDIMNNSVFFVCLFFTLKWTLKKMVWWGVYRPKMKGVRPYDIIFPNGFSQWNMHQDWKCLHNACWHLYRWWFFFNVIQWACECKACYEIDSITLYYHEQISDLYFYL